jgi:hypothetical protein
MPFPVRSIRPARNFLLTALTAALLTACGGGGGGSAPTVPTIALVSPAVLSNEQAQQIAGRVISTLGFGLSGTIFSQALYDIAVNSPAASGTEACSSGGTVSYAKADVTPVGVVSAGDDISLSASGCTDSSTGAGVRFSGAVAERVTAVTGTPYSAFAGWALTSTQTYTNLLVATGGLNLTFNGILSLNDRDTLNEYAFASFSINNATTQRFTEIRTGGMAIVGSPLPDVKLGFQNLVMQTSLSPTEKINVSATQTPTQQIFLNGTTQQVTSGVLPIVLDRARILVTVTGPNTVRLDLDNNADGTIDSTQNLTWTGLAQAGTL